MKFSTKGPEEKEKKEKRKSIANEGIIIGKRLAVAVMAIGFQRMRPSPQKSTTAITSNSDGHNTTIPNSF